MSNINHGRNTFKERCADYVLDLLGPKEREQFEQELRKTDKEKQELCNRMQSLVDDPAFRVEDFETPQAAKEQLLEQTSQKNVPVTSKKSTLTTAGKEKGEKYIAEEEGIDRNKFAIVLSVVLFFITLMLVFYTLNLSYELGQKEKAIEQQQSQIKELQTEVAQKEELLSILNARQIEIVFMNGLDVNPNGYGKVIWNLREGNALLQLANLPAPPDDNVYQLWVIRNNQPTGAGVFFVEDPATDHFFRVENLGNNGEEIDSFTVTLEPGGGSPQPTGDIYLLGNRESN